MEKPDSILEGSKLSLRELSIKSEGKVADLLQNYGGLEYPTGMIKLVLRDALRTSQRHKQVAVDKDYVLGELLAIQLQEYPIAEYNVEGVSIILCGIREFFFPSRVQDLFKQNKISSILNLGAMNGFYLPEDLNDVTELPPPILNIYSDDDPKSEWPLDHLAVLTDQLVQHAKNENKTVIIHCKEGKSRSVSVLIAYLIFKGTFDSVDMCLDSIQQQRAIAGPNLGFMVKLHSFAERVSGLQNSPITTLAAYELITEINRLCESKT